MKGELLSNDNLSNVNFYLQSGDIKEVVISDQQRKASRSIGYASLWQSQIMLNRKKKTLYLYANSIETALAITTDFVEQTFEGSFDFKSFKELDYSNLLNEKTSEDMDVDTDIYKIEIELTENDESYNASYVVHGTDAENCKKIIFDFITAKRINENESIDFELKIISAKTIPCNNIIDPIFSKKYLE